MIVEFANNQTMIAIDTDTSAITTDPYPMGDANYVIATMNVQTIFSAGGTPDIKFEAQASNDGQNWFAVPAVAGNTSTTTGASGPVEGAGEFTSAYIRFEFVLTPSAGTGGQISAVTFDVHAHLIHK